jgi:chain length determinant protein tyrosine kinase EpsG
MNVSGKAMKMPRAARDRGRAIGSILVDQGRLSADDVDQIRSFAEEHGLRFGDAAVRLNLITQTDIDYALAQQFNYPILARGGEDGVSDELIAAYNPQSEMVEPLRAIRSQLLLRWPPDANRKVLAIVSPERGEGRSWLAANLAIVFAQIGERTLLIDTDMRHPRQHQLFNMSNETGLSALLTGRAGREIARRIHPQLRLFVLPAGILPPNPQELLGRPVFDLVLDRFAEQFDIVVLDTPAATDTADAQIVSARAGAAMMVARRNHTHHTQITEGMRRLSQAGVNVIGSVIMEH